MIARRNVLIFHSGALGDFLLTWPLALALGRVLPQSRIFYVTHREKGILAEKVLRVESIDVESGWHHLFSEDAQLPEPAKSALLRAQWVFTFVSGPDSVWVRNVRTIAPEAQIVSLSQMPSDTTGHVLDHLVAQLAPWPAWQQAVVQMLRSIEHRGVTTWAAGPTPLIHPGSGGVHKCWSINNFLELAQRLNDAGHRPRILIGDVEQDRWPAEKIDAFAPFGDVRRSTHLPSILEDMTGGSVFIGNDSGPGHLAAMLGIPTISLFGPTDPAVWRALGPHVYPLRKSPLDALSVDEVYDVVRKVLGEKRS